MAKQDPNTTHSDTTPLDNNLSAQREYLYRAEHEDREYDRLDTSTENGDDG